MAASAKRKGNSVAECHKLIRLALANHYIHCGQSQGAVAKELGRSEAYLSTIFRRGHTFRSDDLKKMAVLFAKSGAIDAAERENWLWEVSG